MNDHALAVLEFHKVLEHVARRAGSELGREAVLRAVPVTVDEDVARELARVGEAMRFVEDGPGWALGPVPDVRPALSELAVSGAALDPVSLYRIATLLETSRIARAQLTGREAAYPALASVTERLVAHEEVEDTLRRSVGEEGDVLSTASRELRGIRDKLRGAQLRIVRRLETFLASLPERFVVPDASVTIRDGRYVVPIRREGRSEVGGIVHDESQTGATLFVEPPAAIEAMSRLRDLERDEAREVRRILGALTAALAPLRHELVGTVEALADFDSLLARARSGRAWGASIPEIAPPGTGLRLREARHPLLVETGVDPVVPFDLDLHADERCLVVSGPNTGGKSVLLKAVGLLSALTQSGIAPPVGGGTRLPVFRSFFADIGDEQSIARNLSTFSAHLSNLADVVQGADERSLVLLDEMGTGTDPAEGAALARAVLEELVAKGATTLVSSHLGALKHLDEEGSGIVNASLQFDGERLEPTYRLVKGRPGRSWGLAIARRLGFPPHVLDRADRHRDADEATFEEVLERLEEQERRAEALLDELASARARAEAKGRDVEERESALREAERAAEEVARTEAHKLLMAARSEVESAIRELREDVADGADVDEAARRARVRVERAATRERRERDRARGPRRGDDVPPALSPGDHVRVHATGAKGVVAELREGRALVEVGALRMELPVEDLRPAEAPAEQPTGRRRGGWRGPELGQARTEVDLRGLRVDEMDRELERALDEAVFEDLDELRIIHGKGTGALRQRVGELLDADGRVRRHRMGVPAEGGAGVTIATLREAP